MYAQSPATQPNSACQHFSLRNRQTATLQTQKGVLSVLRGTAWVSVSGKDHVVEQGSTLVLPAADYPAIVSRVGDQTLEFDVVS